MAKCRITAAAGRVRPNRDRAPWLVVAVPASGVGARGRKRKGVRKTAPLFHISRLEKREAELWGRLGAKVEAEALAG